jgi:hypothetical protein
VVLRLTHRRTHTEVAVDAEDLRSLSRILLYGGPGTRRALARRLAGEDGQELWRLLVSTVRSDEPWLLRARCLEVIGLVAGSADPQRAAAILEALREPDPDEGSPLHRSVTIS